MPAPVSMCNEDYWQRGPDPYVLSRLAAEGRDGLAELVRMYQDTRWPESNRLKIAEAIRACAEPLATREDASALLPILELCQQRDCMVRRCGYEALTSVVEKTSITFLTDVCQPIVDRLIVASADDEVLWTDLWIGMRVDIISAVGKMGRLAGRAIPAVVANLSYRHRYATEDAQKKSAVVRISSVAALVAIGGLDDPAVISKIREAIRYETCYGISRNMVSYLGGLDWAQAALVENEESIAQWEEIKATETANRAEGSSEKSVTPFGGFGEME